MTASTSYDLTLLSATELGEVFRRRQVSPVEVMQAVAARIDAMDGVLHAMVTADIEHAMAQAKVAEARLMQREPVPPLVGVPFVAKDTIETAGVRTTYGSLKYKDNVPHSDAISVARLRAAGAILVGKTNTPEWAAGANTTNLVAGTTLNPWDTSRSSGGSSGGSGVALATGMAALALGTDHGGSVRQPAAMNGVVGLRPTPGLVPVHPVAWASDFLHLHGPMARCVDDIALCMTIMSGSSPMVPIEAAPSRDTAIGRWTALGELRLACSSDLGGMLTLDADVSVMIEQVLSRVNESPAQVQFCHPDFSGLPDAITPLRQLRALIVHADELPTLGGIDSAGLRESIRAGFDLTGADVAAAERCRSDVWFRNVEFFDRFDALLLPTCQISSFGYDEPGPLSLGGRPLADAVSWALSTYLITLMGWPAISIPCGRTDAGIPVGLQVVGPRGSEGNLLRVAGLLERTFDFSYRPPPMLGCDNEP